jgi:hypothetical protein
MAGSLLVAACGGGPTDIKVPGAISVSPTSVALDAVGQTQQLTASVTDVDGNPISSPSVSWSSDHTSVATVTGTGLVSAAGSGTAVITATAGSVTATASATVTQTPTQLQKVTGDQQTANVGQTTATPLTVQVNDATGHPIQGVTIGFTVDPQLGSLGSPTGVTGADGRAASSFTVLGSGTISVTAGVASTTLSTTFTETGISPYAIELQFLTTPTAAQQQALLVAQQRWQGLVVGDVPNVQLTSPAGSCGVQEIPALNRQVDDVLIFVLLEPIDGAGGILGQSGPCFVRTGSRLPVMGIMRFDTADLDFLQTNGLLSTVMTHEMGHVLGFGTIWTDLSLLADASLPPTNGTDPHFTGAQAIAGFNAVGGSSYNASAKVPVEDTNGPGTADSHWRETVFANELMTGFVELNGPNPLSRVTVASMADLGYTVNLAGADPYTLPPPALRAFARGPQVVLKNDLLRLPIRVVDERGRVERVIQP